MPPQQQQQAIVAHRRAVAWTKFGLLVMLNSWLLAISWGYFFHEGKSDTPAEGIRLPLLWFDRQVLRRFGEVLPLIFPVLRWQNNLLACGVHGRPIHSRTLVALYAYILFARRALYTFHSAGYLSWVNQFFPKQVAASDHVMSDHIFLSAAITAILMCEMAFFIHLTSYMQEWQVVPRRMKWQSQWAHSLALVCFLLYLFVVLDTGYSAAYFHWRTHNNAAAVLGFLAFQLPALRILKFF